MGPRRFDFEGRALFVNAERIAEKMRALADEANPRVVALDFSGVPDLEYTALKMMIEAEKRQRERGVSIWLVGLNPEVLSVIQRSPLGNVLGRERMHFNLEVAVRSIWQLLRQNKRQPGATEIFLCGHELKARKED